MKLGEALAVIRRHGCGVAVRNNDRNEHHIQYELDQYGRILWTAGGTAGGLAHGSHIPNLNKEGYKVFRDLYSHTELS